MSIIVSSGAVLGVDAYRVRVEVDSTMGCPQFDLVGLPEGAVRESRVRVRSAIRNSGLRVPFYQRHFTVNLAPAGVKKDGAAFDLPIAIGCLAASQLVPSSSLQDTMFVGELSLNGEIRPVRGVLPQAIMARQQRLTTLVVPRANAPEASVVGGVEVLPTDSLGQLVEVLNGDLEAPLFDGACHPVSQTENDDSPDLRDVKGQQHVKRALEVAAAGGHNLLMIGPPGSGKTMMARRLSSILPPMSFQESVETTKIYSVAGLLPEQNALLTARPFRSPHHTISDAGLVGGGAIPRPGEISLAHHGVLFLDELPEFHRRVLEVLRQPLEERSVTISRAAVSLRYPADLVLVAAMNPCPCGHLGDPRHACTCTHAAINRYRNRISGPLLDRIDLHVEVPAVPFEEMASKETGEPSEVVRRRVVTARERQLSRFHDDGLFCNARMNATALREYCRPDDHAMQLLEAVMKKRAMSARTYDRIIKVSRTIADLENEDQISARHVSEAVQYRSMERQLV